MKRRIGKRRASQKVLTDEARGRECMVRSPVCCFDPEQTTPAHYRGLGLSGGGFICEPIFVAWACTPCHTLLDSGRYGDVQMTREDRDTLHIHGILRTQAVLAREGKIQW